MRVSIIITARDEDPAVLDATLAGLEASTSHLCHEVIVIDDASRVPVTVGATDGATDATEISVHTGGLDRESRRHRHGDVRVVRNETAIGVCASRRLGASIAVGDVFVWIDAHMRFGEHWLEQMLLHADARTVVCSPFWTYELDQCLCWGADFAWNGTRDYPSQRYPGFGLRHRTTPPAADAIAVDVPMMIGACYLMRRDACAWLGGFSPHFRVWGVDEQDVSARAWMSGMRVRCAVHARVGHLSRAAFPYPVQFEHVEFNQLALIRTLFEPETVRRLEAAFDPCPPVVARWLNEAAADLASWRHMLHAHRVMSDAGFFARFVPELAAAMPPALAASSV